MKQLGRTYKVEDKEYNYDIKNLKYLYSKFINMPDEDFLDRLPDALHFTCYVSWIKEVKCDEILSDTGLIHELVHLLKPSTRQYTDLKEVRKKFEEILII